MAAGLAMALIGSGLSSVGGTARASTTSLHPDGGGVPTTRTDASKFKNCKEPAGDSLWETAKPEEVGLDARALDEASDYWTHHLQATLRVYRFGCLVHTSGLDPIHERLLTAMWSTTKPISTLVLGRAIRLGLISVSDTVGKYFPNEGDAAHRAITVKQLLQHTSGLYKNWLMEGSDEIPDQVKYFFDLSLVHPRGTFFDYCQVCANMTNVLTEKAVGMKFQEFAQKEVFDRIGILPGTYVWKTDRAGHTYGFSELYLRPIDMVRIGQLELNGGVYRGERLISEQFIKDMATGSAENPGFGYNTWVNASAESVTAGMNKREVLHRPLIASAPHDMYYSWAWRGRHIMVMPNLGMIVTMTPITLQVPAPGQIYDGYPGHDATYEQQIDSQQISQGEANAGYHEFFRILMRAVTDQKIGDPGPWDQPPDNEFDPDPWLGHSDQQLHKADPTNTDYSGWSWFAGVPAAYAKALSTK
jgi:CubicO group peptidase (beta-lactamase class C family)